MNGDRQAVEELVTVRDLVRWGASRFLAAGLHYGHGTDNPFDEAAWLVSHALHLSPQTPLTDWLDARLTRAERESAVALLARRADERVPVPYITGEAWFAGMPFHVDERVLIPRSPVAELIESGFAPWVDPEAVTRVLDLCTGSGCIAIATAAAMPWAEVVGADVSEPALEVAERNVARHRLEGQVHLVRSDLFEAVEGRFDIIVSNPPYVDAEDMAELPAEYRHEPELALAAGDDGLDLVLRMLRDANEHLNPDGILVVEVGNSEFALSELLPDVPFVWLEFEHGGQGVFLLTAEQVAEYHGRFVEACAVRSI